jgi:chain length determinant protein EpsF
VTLRQFLFILRARRNLVLGVLVGIFLLVLIITLVLPNKYTATTAIVVDMNRTDPVFMMPSQFAPGYLATQIDIIESERVAQRVVAMTNMDRIPVIEKQWRDETEGKGSLRSWVAQLLQRQLKVKPGRESSVIEIRYTGFDPVFAAAVANAFAQAYIEISIAIKVESARQYARFFNEQTRDYLAKLETAQRSLSEYEQQHALLVNNNQMDIENQHLMELNSQYAMAVTKAADSESRNGENVGAVDTLPEVIASPLITSLKADLARKEADLGQMLGKYGPNHPLIIEARTQISSMKQQLKEETDRISASRGTSSVIGERLVTELAAKIGQQKARIMELKGDYDKLAVLRRDVENAQKTYDFVKQGLEQKHIESQTQQTNISVLTPAEPPMRRSSPLIFLNLIIAVFLGGLFGIGTALVLELLSPRVRSSDDLTQFEGVPILGIIPMPNIRRTPRLRLRPTA